MSGQWKARTVPPVMVLKEASDSRLRFQFRSVLWGCITAALAGPLWLLAWHMIDRQDVAVCIRVFIYILPVAFTYSTIYSFTTRRTLEIDLIRRVVTLTERNLFKEKVRTDAFEEFARISVGRVRRRSSNYGIALEYKDGWVEYLGWSEFGALSLTKAMDLVNRFAPAMGIEIDAPTLFQERPLRGDQG